jgi:hypothetical protein
MSERSFVAQGRYAEAVEQIKALECRIDSPASKVLLQGLHTGVLIQAFDHPKCPPLMPRGGEN